MFSQLTGVTWRMDPEQADVARKGIQSILQDTWLAPLVNTFIRETVSTLPERELLESLAAPGAPDLGSLLGWLGTESPIGTTFMGDPRELRHTERLDAIWVALARFVAQRDTLQGWGNLRLHETAHRAFTTPALIMNSLFKVKLDGSETEIPSVLRVDGDLSKAELTIARSVQGSTILVRGIKRLLLRPVPLPAGIQVPAEMAGQGAVNSDLLIAQAYSDLVRRVTHFAWTEIPGADGLKVKHTVITYPTTTPPSVRERLRALIRRRVPLGRISMQYDEGVAALLFTVMRDFGGSRESGIQTFRARSRPVGDLRWRRNVLVIDIGGGTTDIAFTALELSDLTPGVDKAESTVQQPGQIGEDGSPTAEIDAAGPQTMGRVYRLRPRVLGSTGHPQWGGDLLTLRVYYWLKALMADGVRTGAADDTDAERILADWPQQPGGGAYSSLARAVVEYREEGPAPSPVATFLRQAIPTAASQRRNRGGTTPVDSARLTAAFDALWRIAEDAKRQLATGQPYQVEAQQVTAFASSLGTAPWAPRIGGLEEKDLLLRPEHFARLARAVLSPSINLAVDLAWRQLGTEPDELLDGIELTGRATQMPLVRKLILERLATVFGNRDRNGQSRPWNPAVVSVEYEHPKQAASIGACWAKTIYESTPVGREGLATSSRRKSGSDELLIDVDNLLMNLPCRFGLGTNDRPLHLLHHGQRLTLIDRAGRRFVRSRWQPVTPDIRLLRFLDDEQFIEWGRYNYEDQRGTRPPAGLRFQIELDQELTPTLHFCLGQEPHYVLDGSRIDLRRQLPRHCISPDGALRSLPRDLSVLDIDEVTGADRWQLVFPAEAQLPAEFFRNVFDPLGTAGRSERAAIATEALPAESPPRTGNVVPPGMAAQPELRFAATPSSQGEPANIIDLGSVAALGRHQAHQAGQGHALHPAHWAILDAHGMLHIAPEYPRYVTANDMDDMEQHPGSVFSTPMGDPQPFGSPDWNPFSGEH